MASISKLSTVLIRLFADCRIGTTVSPLILWYCNHNLGLGLSAYDQIDTRELRPSVFTAMLLFPEYSLTDIQPC